MLRYVEASIPEGGGRTAGGTLVFVNNTVDQGTGTVLLKSLFPNDDEVLWPGELD